MYRLFVIAVVVMWVSAMACLFVHDVWPAWTAQDAPPMTREQFARLDQTKQQCAILDADGQRLGTAWSNVSTTEANTTIYGTVRLNRVMLFPPLLVETTTQLEPTGCLDSFSLDVYGVPVTRISIHGEKRGIYFPCELQVGPLHRQANLDLAASRMIGESLRPFGYLPTLKVGQAWRMQLIDPLSAVITRRTQFNAIVARVTGTETIEHLGQQVQCFVIQTSDGQVKAWADRLGRVLVQRVDVPGLGPITVRQEPYDEQARLQARRRTPGQPGPDAPTVPSGLPGLKRPAVLKDLLP